MTERTCTAPEGCDRPIVAHEYCGKHYQRWRKHGDVSFAPHGGRKRTQGACTECDEPAKAHGYCNRHYCKWRRWGDPNYVAPPRERPTCSECERPARALGYCTMHYRRFKKHGDASVVKKSTGNPRRKYSLNQDYFGEIDTPEKAYWLGFITADGGVGASGGDFFLRVELARIDIGHLRKLASALESDAPVRLTRQNCASITFHSKRLVEGLAALGVTERKSLVVTPPLERLTSLQTHYWRGLWDGDGHVSVRANRRAGWHIGVVGSRACIDGFASWAREISGSVALATNRTSKNSACWRWDVGGTRKPQLLAAQLRLAAPEFGLDRKQVLLDEVCAFDLDSHEARWKEARGALMRDLWTSGRNPRAKH